MSAKIDDLQTMLEAEEIVDGCIDTRDARTQCCRFFRESGRFNPALSYQKIGATLNLDAKTVWPH
jgi:hypothetical protein